MAARLGTGARFKALETELASRPGVRDPAALAAAIGRTKFSKKRFQKLSAKGRRRRVVAAMRKQG